MIINEIQIDNFGKFQNFNLSNLNSGINYIEGLNEFGKSTLAEFICRIFYDFPDKTRRTLNQYPSNCDDKNYGGHLICTLDDGRKIIISRKGKGKNQEFSIKEYSTLEIIDYKEVIQLEESFYREVYAITLAQLADGGVFQEKDSVISHRLYGVNYVANSVNVGDLIKFFTTAADKLFKPAGKTQEIIKLHTELKERVSELEIAEQELLKSQKIDVEIVDLEKKIEPTKKLVSLKELEQTLQGKIATKNEKITELSLEFEKIKLDQPILNAENQINKSVQNSALYHEYLKVLERENSQIDSLEKQIKAKKNEFVAFASNEIFKYNLFSFLEKRQTAKKADKISNEKNVLILNKKNRLLAIIKIISLAMIAFLLLSFIMIAFLSKTNGAILASFATIMIVILFLAKLVILKKLSLEKVDNIDNLSDEFKDFLEKNNLDNFYNIDEAIADFTTALEVDTNQVKLREMKVNYSSTKLKIDSLKAEFLDLKQFVSNSKTDVLEYVKECANLLKVNKYLEIQKNQIKKLLDGEMQNLKKENDRCTKVQEELLNFQDNGVDLEILKDNLTQDLNLLAVKKSIYKNLLDNNQIEIARSKVEIMRNQLKSLCKSYLSYRVALKLVNLGVERFETEHQGEIIDNASNMFKDITNNNYNRIKKSLLTNEVVCYNNNNDERLIGELSTGTREQLLLTMRLSLIDYIEKNINKLPVLLDDVLVNFDGDRERKMIDVIDNFAKNRQVFFFKLVK